MSVLKLKKCMPIILTGISVASTVGAVYFTYKKAPEISAVISDRSLTKGQRFINVCKVGAIPLFLTTLSGGCTIGAQVMNSRTITGLTGQLTTATATAAIATKELRELSDKTKEVVGEEKFKDIKEEIAKDRVANTSGRIEEVKDPVNVTQVEHINTVGSGNTLWYDERHDRWFRTTPANVEAALKKFNHLIFAYDFGSYQELYCQLGLTAPPSDENIGYTIQNHPDGVSLANFGTVEYPETGEVARIFAIQDVPEFNPDYEAGDFL